MPRPLRRSLFALLVLPTLGCDPAESPTEPWMAPPQVGGKADAIATLDAADIPSAFVNPNAPYLHDRSIWGLNQVGALDEVQLTVAQRADGIIDALPADGRLDVEELVRLEESPYFDLLFPNEQAALPTLWPFLEAPTSQAVTIAFDELDPLEVEERTVAPGDLQVPDSILIVEFPSDLHMDLMRLQLGFDEDGDDATVSLDDLDAAIAQPGPFTPAEIESFEEARLLFLERADGNVAAVIAVPTPGEEILEESMGPITFRLTANTRYEETWSSSHFSVIPTTWSTRSPASSTILKVRRC